MKYFILFISFLFFNIKLFSNDFQTFRDSTKFYQEKQDYNSALKWSKLTLEAAEKEFGNRDTNYIQTIMNHGDLFKNLNQLDSAIYWMELNWNITNEIFVGNHYYKVLILKYLGEFYERKSIYFKAENYYQQSFEMNKTENGLLHFETASLIHRLSSINRNMGRMDIAEKYYNLGLDVFPKIYPKGDISYAIFLNGLATYHKIKGDYKKSEEYYLNAIDMMKNLDLVNDFNFVTFTNNLGAFYFGVANYEKAKYFFNEALQTFKKISKTVDKLEATIYHNLAFIEFILENYTSAESLFVKAIELKREIFKDLHNDIAVSLKGIGDLYSATGNYEKAEKAYIEAIEIRRKIFKESHPDLGNAINSLGFLYFDKYHNFEKALPLFIEALQINSKFYKKNNLESVSTLRNAALAFEYIGQYEKCDSLWDVIISDNKDLLINYFSVISEEEKMLLSDKIEKYVVGYSTFCVSHFDKIPSLLTKFFNNQLYFKSIILNETKKLKEIVNAINDSSFIKLFDDWEKTKEEIAKYYTLSPNQLKSKNINLDSIINYANEQERELVKSSEYFKNELYKKHITLKDIQDKLSPNSAAIEIVRIDFHDYKIKKDSILYAALILKKNSENPEIVVFRNGFEMEDEILKTYKAELKTDDDNKVSYKNYWQPIAEKLGGIKKVYISPDGVYNKINLSTLKNTKTKKYLDDEVEIITLTNLKDIVNANTSPVLAKSGTYELFGSPAFDELIIDSVAVIAGNNRGASELLDSNDRAGIQLHPLPNTRTEIEEISKILSKMQVPVKKYLDKDANEKAVKSINNPTVLHLATHGYFLKDIELSENTLKSYGDNKSRFNENPLLRSMLFFSGAKKSLENPKTDAEIHHEDGILTAYEAQNLNLQNTELVVLAACETGLGEIKNGEGVYGLQRSFIQAGAKTLIMSLWQSNDKATKDLMINFYKEWLNGKSKREAFALAKKKVREIYRYPAFWGAYVMIGE